MDDEEYEDFEEDLEDNAILAAIMTVAGVITVFWMESLLVILAAKIAISELILWPLLAIILFGIAYKMQK
jgi:hypothetical protein